MRGKGRERSPGLQVINSKAFDQIFQFPAKSTVTPSPSPQTTLSMNDTPLTTKSALTKGAESAAATSATKYRKDIHSSLTDPFDQQAGNDPFIFVLQLRQQTEVR